MLAFLGRILSKDEGTETASVYPADSSAFIASLYQKYRAFLFRKASTYTDSLCAQEDIVQNTVLRLIRNEKRLLTLEPAALATYISLTIRSAAMNYLQDEQRNRLDAIPFSDSEELDHIFYVNSIAQSTLEEKMIQDYQSREIRAAIGRLSERDQIALLGKYFLGLDSQELAKLLGVSMGNLRTLLSRARVRALNELKKEGVLHE